MSETLTEKQVRLVLEAQCRAQGVKMRREMPAGVGFVLVMYDYGGEGNMAFISTGHRGDTIKMLRELIGKIEAS